MPEDFKRVLKSEVLIVLTGRFGRALPWLGVQGSGSFCLPPSEDLG